MGNGNVYHYLLCPAVVGTQNPEVLCQSVDKKKRIGLSLWLKMGDPYLLHIGGPKSPPQASRCDSYTALRQTEHPGVFILYVEASRFVAEVIGQKQSLVLNWFYIRGGCDVLALQCDTAVREGFFFLFFSSFENWLQYSEGPTVWNVCTSWRSGYF